MFYFQHEVDLCRKEQPFEIKVKRRESVLEDCPVSPSSDMETESAEGASARSADPVDSNQPSTSAGVTNDKLIPQNPTKTGQFWRGSFLLSLMKYKSLKSFKTLCKKCSMTCLIFSNIWCNFSKHKVKTNFLCSLDFCTLYLCPCYLWHVQSFSVLH